eukprot:8748350-Pyramimonas_sp.AAC.1
MKGVFRNEDEFGCPPGCHRVSEESLEKVGQHTMVENDQTAARGRTLVNETYRGLAQVAALG